MTKGDRLIDRPLRTAPWTREAECVAHLVEVLFLCGRMALAKPRMLEGEVGDGKYVITQRCNYRNTKKCCYERCRCCLLASRLEGDEDL